MGKYQVDRDVDYMYQMWGTTSLITDYWTKPKKSNDCAEEICIQEIMHDDLNEDQENLQE